MASINYSHGNNNQGLQVGISHGNITSHFHSSDSSESAKNQACLQELFITDSNDDKSRIEQTKGGLLEESYRWIVDNEEFKAWRDSQDIQLLWIKGDPGKGKTMLLCGIIDELQASDLSVAFHFCQANDPRLNNATAVLRDLIYSLVNQQPSLLAHVRQRYDQAGKKLFADPNAWQALTKVFRAILDDPSLQKTFLIVDALDECVHDLPLLLELIALASSTRPHIKWIVSSRNWPEIEERLQVTESARLSLELNEASVSEAVSRYIDHKVNDLALLKKYNANVRESVHKHLMSNSQGTFLWVSLVCQTLVQTARWNTLAKLNQFPPGLTGLYGRMMGYIETSDNADLCKSILSIVSTVYQPITLSELTSLIEIPDEISYADDGSLVEIIGLCGSFLALREQIIFWVHQSAKDFIVEQASDRVSVGVDEHHKIFSRSLQIMGMGLQRDIYGLKHPGVSIEDARTPNHDPLLALKYSCLYWIDHLCECTPELGETYDTKDDGPVEIFFMKSFLHWIEALSLLRSIEKGTLGMIKLQNLIKGTHRKSRLFDRIIDGCHFIRYHKTTVEMNPLQVYYSALLFSPSRSLTKNWFQSDKPDWVDVKTAISDDWGISLFTLEQTHVVNSVAWSSDGRVASASWGSVVKIWDPRTGQCIATLEKDTGLVGLVAWSLDGRLASGSKDTHLKILDPSTGQCTATLRGHTGQIFSVAWSSDGRIASGSEDRTVRIWDPITSQCIAILKEHTDFVRSVAWSSDGRLASGSTDKTIKIWNSEIGKCITTLSGHLEKILSIAWSSDGRVASGALDETVKIWESEPGQCIATLHGHEAAVQSVAWSSDGRVASGSEDQTVRIWDPITSQCITILKEHTSVVFSVAWSSDGRIASGSLDGMVKIWDIQEIPDDTHSSSIWKRQSDVKLLAWSPDGGELALGTESGHIQICDPVGDCRLQFEAHSWSVAYIIWSPNGDRIASLDQGCVKLWDSSTGKRLGKLQRRRGIVEFIRWSHESLLALISTHASHPHVEPGSIQFWNTMTYEFIKIKSMGESSSDPQIKAQDDEEDETNVDDTDLDSEDEIDYEDDSDDEEGKDEDDEIDEEDGMDEGDEMNEEDKMDDDESDDENEEIQDRDDTPSEEEKSELTLRERGHWIAYGGMNLLKIPPEYRSYSGYFKVSGQNMAIASDSGSLLILRFAQNLGMEVHSQTL